MADNYKKILREELDSRLRRWMEVGLAAPLPESGWVGLIRKSLGMTGEQLAKRMGVAQSAIAQLEKRESTGDVTIATLKKAADALNCTMVYAFVPNESLSAMVEIQARKLASKLTRSVSQPMMLEGQSVAEEVQRYSVEETVQEIVRQTPKAIWDV
jgi:predicted DNA-binding mobile mystery protein A